MSALAVSLFVLSYVAMSSKRVAAWGIDRALAAWAGAVAFVGLGVLSPVQAIASVDGRTLLLLLSVMGIGASLVDAGLFELAEAALLARVRTREQLLAVLVVSAGLAAAWITNDAVCLIGTPLVLRVTGRLGLRPLPYLLALATAANTGSAATLVGNPQNMLCAALGTLDFRTHLVLVGPAAVLALGVNWAVLRVAFHRELAGPPLAPAATPAAVRGPSRTTIVVLSLTALALLLGGDLAWSCAGGFALLSTLERRRCGGPWDGIDWSLLVFFAGLFVIVRGLEASGVPALGLERARPWLAAGDVPAFVALVLLGANLVSNVPFILLVRSAVAATPDPELSWLLLAMVSTFAGNLTLLGSAANVIVADGAREQGGVGFLEHLRVGGPIAILTTLVGVGWVVLARSLGA